VSVDVCVLQLQSVVKAMIMKTDGSKHRMDVNNGSAMMAGGR